MNSLAARILNQADCHASRLSSHCAHRLADSGQTDTLRAGHPGLNLMMNGAYIQITLEAFECGLNICQLGISLPEYFRVLRLQARA